MRFPMEGELRAERVRFIETLGLLTDEEFDSGKTLCEGWAPRDVLGHVIGVDYLLSSYLSYRGRINAANGVQAERARRISRTRLMEWAWHWSAEPSPTSRFGAPLILGDLAIHHQDVLRGLGLRRQVPDPVATAILREGMQLSLWLNRRVLRHPITPTDGPGAFRSPFQSGPEVRGTREALGMWLAGRDSAAAELEFAD